MENRRQDHTRAETANSQAYNYDPPPVSIIIATCSLFVLPYWGGVQVHYVTCNTTSLTQSQALILTITHVGTYIPRTTYSGYIRDYFAACINIIPFPLLILLITCTQELYYIFPNHTWFLFLSPTPATTLLTCSTKTS